MSIAEIIQTIGLIVTSLLSIISIAIAVLTLRQNNKMIEESTRPYIQMSYEVMNTGSANTFFLLKNYGQSGAKICDFSYDFSELDKDIDYQFSKIIGTYLAPGQKNLYWFNSHSIPRDEINFQISYQTDSKIYSENISLKIHVGAISLRSNCENAISYTIQEIAERLF